MKKVSVLLLVLLMLLPLVSCAGNDAGNSAGKVTDGNTASETAAETAAYDDGLGENFKYDGYAFTIFVPGPDSLGIDKIEIEKLNGDTIDDARYTRNAYVEERFGVTIKAVTAGDSSNIASSVTPFMLSGEDAIDLIFVTFQQSAKALLLSGNIMAWNDVPYINLERDYWNNSIIKTAAINDNYYFISGDINWNWMEQVYLMLFNKKVAADYNSESIYDIVNSGRWTIDTLLNMTEGFSSDINGDGKLVAADDMYAICYNSNFFSDVFLTAFNIDPISINDGELKIDIINDKTQTAVEKVNSLFNEKDRVYKEPVDENNANSVYRKLFFENRALFLFCSSGNIQRYRSEDSDFGIIPMPKYDEAQTEYKTISDQWGMVCALPITTTDTERTGVITEALCAASLHYIRPAYYDIALTNKAIRDTESGEMLDLIFKGVTYTFYHFYLGGLSNTVMGNPINSKNTDIASWYATNESKISDNYNEILQYTNVG